MSTPTDRQTPSESVLARGLQKLDLKLYLTLGPGVHQDDVSDRLIAVFGRWRLEEGEELVDLQDYAHVPEGPGIVLVSKRWVFGIDWTDGEPGILLSTRRGLDGTLPERFTQAMRLLAGKAERLTKEGEFEEIVKPRCGELSIAVNDRLLFPNTDEADAVIRPAVEGLAERLHAGAPREIERVNEPRARLSYRIRAREADALTLEELTGRLSG